MNWVAFVLTAFLGAVGGVVTLTLGVVAMLGWEVYQYRTQKGFSLTHSVKDFLVGVIVIVPQLLVLLKLL